MKKTRRGLLLALTLAIAMVSVPTGIVYATSTQEKLNQAQEDKKQTQSQLNETKENLEGLKEEKDSLEGKLADLNEKLIVVSSNLNDLEQIERNNSYETYLLPDFQSKKLLYVFQVYYDDSTLDIINQIIKKILYKI